LLALKAKPTLHALLGL
jgi:hypothetical protein